MAICDTCYFSLGVRNSVSEGKPCSCGNHSTDLPDDYEVCCTCGYDHSYELEEAMKEHAAIARAKEESHNEL